jgi:hypothetical protein
MMSAVFVGNTRDLFLYKKGYAAKWNKKRPEEFRPLLSKVRLIIFS